MHRPRNKTSSAKNGPSRRVTRRLSSTTTDTGYWSRIQIRQSRAESRTRRTVSLATKPGSLSGFGGSPGHNLSILHSEKRLPPAPNSERHIFNRKEFSRLYPASGSTLKAPEADETLSSNWTPPVCRDGGNRPVEESRAGEYLHSGHNQPFYQSDELCVCVTEWRSFNSPSFRSSL